ncbi:hypothetical protein Ae201684_010833 [Aphanomyces euteiches]|uniref:Uncharacterized protein n=1 Tax=Aphanomyces euteiches TaxID=100861 RepID=A0A6G0WXG4_9STRA|nr:hypothetical protein Ae201684_010833 [Aphanomyces euteiches]
MAQIEHKRRVALEKLQKNQKVNCVPQQPLHQVVPNRDVLIQQELDACEDFFDEIPEDISVMTHETTFPNFQLLKAQNDSAVVPNDRINYIPPYKAANKHSVKNNQNYTWQQPQHVKLMATNTPHTSSQTPTRRSINCPSGQSSKSLAQSTLSFAHNVVHPKQRSSPQTGAVRSMPKAPDSTVKTIKRDSEPSIAPLSTLNASYQQQHVFDMFDDDFCDMVKSILA